MDEILYVSKPIAPPWNDSSKNLVWSLAQNLEQYAPRVLTYENYELDLPFGVSEPLFRHRSKHSFASNYSQQLQVLSRLIAGKGERLLHFFFAPNAKSSFMARTVLRTKKLPSVQTVCSIPRHVERWKKLTFANVNVVLSHHTEQAALAAGLSSESVVRIPPCIERLEVDPDRAGLRSKWNLPGDELALVYPGDLEYGGGAERCLHLINDLHENPRTRLVMACRRKTKAAGTEEKRLRELATSLGIADRVLWVGETREIHSLLDAADMVVLPADSLYAKMDYPLVLLEAMALGKTVVVSTGTPSEELASDGTTAVACPRDRDALAAAVRPLLEDVALRTKIGEAAQQLIKTEFTPRTMAGKYEKLYERLL